MTQSLDHVLQQLDDIARGAAERVAAAANNDDLALLRRELLGKKGPLQEALRLLREVPPADKASVGARINLIKDDVAQRLDARQAELGAAAELLDLRNRRLDLSLPGRPLALGALHPINQVRREIEQVFERMGFQIARGPQAEHDYFNFEALNFPPDHPARDAQDTLLLEGELLLRTHTSPVQIRTMLAYEPPFRVLSPGPVYRRDDDITHSPMFHQVEGLHVDRGVGLAHLKGALTHFAQAFFGSDTKIRLRASFFPFTEPSVEIDVGCIFCHGNGCRVCKESGWLEILGAGLVDPAVLENCGVDPEIWSGWAFGMGVERIAMLRYGIHDIRLLYESDVRFLEQFR